MIRYLVLLLLIVFNQGFAQMYSGQVFMRENASLYLNQVYVTNLTTKKTVLSNYNGEFNIPASFGDVVRFTSILSDRHDVRLTQQMLDNKLNFIELKPSYHEIEEVVIRWKPSGNLRQDVLTIKENDKKMEVASIIGRPGPKPKADAGLEPIAGLQGGGVSFSIEGIYDVLSGERKKKQRLYEFEKMMKALRALRQYYGDEYFIKLKIPVHMIDNFLQFVYSSENLLPYLETKNFEATQPSLEKYLPIYHKRLRDSSLSEVTKS